MVWPVRGRAEEDGGREGMEAGGRIRELRTAHGMSQDDLAARVYVSRQTISNWENGKTYPDVQSLLLLSEIFGASVDSLIKGDVEAMNETIERNVVIRRLGAAMIALAACTVAAALWAVAQVEIWGWKGVQVVPTLLLMLVLWACLMFCSHWAERIKRDHDLATFLGLAWMRVPQPARCILFGGWSNLVFTIMFTAMLICLLA